MDIFILSFLILVIGWEVWSYWIRWRVVGKSRLAFIIKYDDIYNFEIYQRYVNKGEINGEYAGETRWKVMDWGWEYFVYDGNVFWDEESAREGLRKILYDQEIEITRKIRVIRNGKDRKFIVNNCS